MLTNMSESRMEMMSYARCPVCGSVLNADRATFPPHLPHCRYEAQLAEACTNAVTLIEYFRGMNRNVQTGPQGNT